MVRVRVSRDPGSGLVAVGLGAEHPAALPRAVQVLDAILGELVVGTLDRVIADARRAGGPVTVDLDELVDRAEMVTRGRDRRADPGP